jgi:hypothetical protein
MYKHWISFLFTVAMMAAARPAQATNYEVGSCLPKLPQFLTIQAAVSSVPPFSTILVCPGVYPEQVTISQPLTLRGQSIHNMDRPVIAVPINPDGSPNLKVNASSSVYPESFAAQVLVQNVSPAGNVSIINVTVDGAGGNLGCPRGTTGLVGIFSDSSSFIQSVTARNQKNDGCGYGIWIENGNDPPESIEVANSSVHDFDYWGITAVGFHNPSVLAAKIQGNFVTGNGSTTDIIAVDISGSITNNVVTGGATGIVDYDGFFPQSPGIAISGNSVADIPTAVGIGISIREGSTASSNKISNVTTGFFLTGGVNANPGPSLLADTTKNTALAVEYNCTHNTTLKSNTFNDSQVAYDNVPTGFVIGGGVNPIYNIDTIQTGSCP